MSNARKRSHGGDSSSSSSSKIDPSRKRHHNHHISTAPNFQTDNHVTPHRNSHQQVMVKRSSFISYSEVSSLPPKVKILCEIVARTPAVTVERVLEDTGIRVSEEDVEEVLKLSYGYPGSAVKFFRWSSFQLNKHSPYAWNLVVDLLGKNCLFDAMWDAIKSMKKEQLLSLATFASVFSTYVIVNRVQEAILSFEVMDQYGVPRDTVALNSLLRSMCREGKTQQAKDYLGILKDKIRVDAETYAVLLEGWEREGDVGKARQTFSEMVVDVGWDTRNMPAYDSFLCTLLKGPDGMHEVIKFFDTMRDRGCYPGMKFLKFSIDECVRKSDPKCAKVFWEAMVRKNICKPDTVMYKSLISLYCNVKDFDSAEKLLDEMVYNGAFPDSETYGLLFHFLIKQRRLRDATPVFKEMVKNEFVPMQEDCSAAVKTYIDAGDPYMGIKVWRCMIENYTSDLDETGNLLVVGLRDMNRIPEAVKCAEDMIERGIKLNSATLSKLKQSLSRIGKAFAYEELLRKWKSH
ncbi:pentatricopeptide repeat-containing protein At1g77360, mitochondrial-like [Sesamum indicum]|uniref:Pentatricopeptide repeat-containing protein At1g77360, mitochondrial-like n=1 Tax=Sesamum indicum TaxID=4182 RepID=A0A6I9UGZ6_SESIN|nr:pentatricopeptide repeat-containing protein At1g77360, mitochondrial-like [Sesamum indicum]